MPSAARMLIPSLRAPLDLGPKALAIWPRTGHMKPSPDKGGGVFCAASRLVSKSAAVIRRVQSHASDDRDDRGQRRHLHGLRGGWRRRFRDHDRARRRLGGRHWRRPGCCRRDRQHLPRYERVGAFDAVGLRQCGNRRVRSEPPGRTASRRARPRACRGSALLPRPRCLPCRAGWRRHAPGPSSPPVPGDRLVLRAAGCCDQQTQSPIGTH